MSLNTQYVISAGRGLSLKTKEVGVEACREGRGADQSRTVGERDPLEEITPSVASYSALIRSHLHIGGELRDLLSCRSCLSA